MCDSEVKSREDGASGVAPEVPMMTCNDASGICCCVQCHGRGKMLPVIVDGDLLGHVCCQKRLWLKSTEGGKRILARRHRAFVAALVAAERDR